MYAYFDRFTIEMGKRQALNCSHQGACDEDVARTLRNPKIRRQLAKISDEDLSATLREYGAWDDEELANRADNEARIVWIAAGDIRAEMNS